MDNSFKDKIKGLVKASNELHKNKTSNLNEYKNLNATIDTELNNAVTDALKEAFNLSKNREFRNQQEFLDTVLEKSLVKATSVGHNNNRFQRIKANHQRMTNQYEKITNEIKQAVKHDWYDKLRFLLFRILTTAGIAGAAVAMAIFAHSLGYETALIKKKSPEQKVAEVIKTKELTQTLPAKSNAKAITQILSTELESKDSK